jgi:hypothetical protein
MELIMLRLTNKADEGGLGRLVDKYGKQEVDRAMTKLREGLELSSRVTDDARSYRDYRLRYSKLGGDLKFYSAKEIEDLQKAYFMRVKEMADDDEQARQEYAEVERQLIHGWRDWDDLVPPAIPPRPADFLAPQTSSYPAPINELLAWGDNLHRSHQFADQAEYTQWKKYIPALTRMALDPGLLKGWVTDPSSWAPWHAIHALGKLQAWESAPALAQLADLENDWLSDHLPHIWADMGGEVEPALWMILEAHTYSVRQRGLAAEGLFKLAEENDPIHHKVASGFGKILNDAVKFDAKLNGYLAMFLKDMKISAETEGFVHKAFAEQRIDSEIFALEDFENNYED